MARENLVIGNLVYLFFVLILVVGLFFFISRAGSQAPLFEQVYAKQIALLINKASPGMEFEIDIFKMREVARKNGYQGNMVYIDNARNFINVKLKNGEGYNYQFFNDVGVVWNNPDSGLLKIKIVEAQNAAQ